MAALLALLLFACRTAPSGDSGTPSPAPSTGEGLFLQGCPVPGEATARSLQEIAEQPWGPDALAAPGDALLLNARAAFVIQGPDDPRTYVHYGGMPIDAVAVDGCAQAGPELLGELGFVVGQLDLLDFNNSGMHMVRGEALRIVADGSDGGPAIVEVDATDDRFWLVELTLIRAVYEDGGRKPLEDLYGLDITLRYTLEPDDTVLQVDVLLDGEPVTDGFLVGAVVFPSDHTPDHAFAASALAVGGFGMDVGVPWVGAGRGEGSTAIAMPGANLAMTEVSGVTALLDSNQALVPLELAAGPQETRFLLSVGPTDPASAAAGLEAWHPDPVPGHAVAWQDLAGTVTDPGGAAVAGARVDVLAQDDRGDWQVLTQVQSDADGRFAGRVLSLGEGLQLQAHAEGRDSSPVVPAGEDLEIGALGALRILAEDGAGTGIPVRVELERTDGFVQVGWPTPQDPVLAVPPGTYQAWLSRGYEHEIVQVAVTVPADGEARVEAELPRVVDTAGWVSLDSHVHAGPSADSAVLPVDRMRTAAGGGLDLVISTDHEAIIDLASAVEEAGLAGQLAYALGSEVTATLPEHTNAWPFPVVEGVRGDPVRWYQLGFPGIYAEERLRGAQVIQLNHSRVNGECGILCVLDWDRMSSAPETGDPEALGLPAGTEIWSWDFDSFEVMNGLRSPYLVEGQERRTGALYDWLAFHNLGHTVAGTAVTDEHGMDPPGQPRTYVRVSDDGAFDAQDAAQGMLAGAAVISAGAFVEVSIDGAGPGETASVDDGEGTLSLRVQGLPEVDVTTVDILVDCDLYSRVEATAPDALVKLDLDLPLDLDGDAYVVVIARGSQPMPRGLMSYDAAAVPRAISSPVFVDGDADGSWTAPGPKACDGVW